MFGSLNQHFPGPFTLVKPFVYVILQEYFNSGKLFIMSYYGNIFTLGNYSLCHIMGIFLLWETIHYVILWEYFNSGKLFIMSYYGNIITLGNYSLCHIMGIF